MSVLAIPRSVAVGDTRRSYTLARLDGITAPLPLILAFHGSLESGKKFRASSGGTFDRLVAEGRAIVAYLDGYKGHWNDSRLGSTFSAREASVDDLSFAQAVVDQLASEVKADPQQVYAVGFSQGGQMVLRLLHDRPALLRGALIIGATMPTPQNWMSTTKPAAVPIMLMHGTDDRFAPYQGGDASLRGFKSRGEHTSSLATARYFADALGLADQPVVSQPAHLAESGDHTVTVRQWGSGDRAVRHYEIASGGHQVPHRGKQSRTLLAGKTTSDIDAGEEFEAFFWPA